MIITITPEIIIILTIIVLVLYEIIFSKNENPYVLFFISFISLSTSLFILVYIFYNNIATDILLFGGRFSLNSEIILLKILFLIITLIILCLSFEDLK